MEQLKKTTIDLYNNEEYKEIAQAIDDSITAVYDQYCAEGERDICGYAEFNVKDSGNFQHIATYAIHGANEHWYESTSIYFPKNYAVCEIQIIVAIMDKNSKDSHVAASEFMQRITKELNSRMPQGSQVENAYLCTLRAMISDETLAFSKSWMYDAAEDAGIRDFRLVDMALDGLLKEGVLEKISSEVYRLSSQALVAALA